MSALKNGDRIVVASVNFNATKTSFDDQHMTHTHINTYSSFVIRTCIICVIYSPSKRCDYDPLNLYYSHDHVDLHCLLVYIQKRT